MCIVLIKHNSLKSDINFHPIFISCFSGSRFFRVQVFQGPGFLGSWSRFFRVRVQVSEVAAVWRFLMNSLAKNINNFEGCILVGLALSGTSFSTTFCVRFFKKNISNIIFYNLTEFHFYFLRYWVKHAFFTRKPFSPLNLDFLNIMLETRLRFS